jgi:hypothetical protein
MRRSIKLLKDESGHVIVLTAPYPSRGRTAPEQTRQELEPSAVANPSQAAVQPVTAHCCFHCKWCGSQILLPHSKMGLPFGDQSARRIDVRSVATICGGCKHVDCYSMFRGARGYDTRNKLVQAPLAGDTICVAWLKCEIKDCPFPVPLFTTIDNDLSVEETNSLSTKWVWEEVTCASGHRIKPATSLDFAGIPIPNGR